MSPSSQSAFPPLGPLTWVRFTLSSKQSVILFQYGTDGCLSERASGHVSQALWRAGSSILNAIIRFVNLDAPLGKQAWHQSLSLPWLQNQYMTKCKQCWDALQAFEITTPLLRTPQPGLTVDGLLGVANLSDGAIDVGKGAPTSPHAHAINLDALLCVWCSSN